MEKPLLPVGNTIRAAQGTLHLSDLITIVTHPPGLAYIDPAEQNEGRIPMKRMTLIVITLCLLLLTAGVTGVVAAQQDARAPQSDKSPVAQFDVTLRGGEEIVGKLIINTNAHTFVFNGKGLVSGDPYWLKCSRLSGLIGTVRANEDGTVHIKGESDLWDVVLEANPTFELGTGAPPVGAGYAFVDLTAEYSEKPFWSYWNVQGTLTQWYTHAPLANEEIEVYQYIESRQSYVLRDTVMTDAAGHYYYSRYASTLGGSRPRVNWHGGYIYDSTYRAYVWWFPAETYANLAA
jgi:hypothetical protein